MNRVYIVGKDYYTTEMFDKRGWEIVLSPWDADLIQFTGGDDVDPSLYGEEKHPRTISNPKRDSEESHMFRSCVHDIPMAGICRGGQFLNVMNGGKMWQHVDGHGMGSHLVYSHGFGWEGKSYKTIGDHHQMMIPNDLKGILVLTASRARLKETATEKVEGDGRDIEAIYYPATNCFCYQPHPEWEHDMNSEGTNLYFDLLSEYLNVGNE